MGSPVWSRDGIIAVGNAHKDKVKLTFCPWGEAFPIPTSCSMPASTASVWRAIDLFEGDKIDERALKNLIRSAIDYNQSKAEKESTDGNPSEGNQVQKVIQSQLSPSPVAKQWERVPEGRVRALCSNRSHFAGRALIRPVGHLLPCCAREKGNCFDALGETKVSPILHCEWLTAEEVTMCRNIRTLFNFEPPASEDEIRGFRPAIRAQALRLHASPSKANEAAFDRAVKLT